MDIESNPNNNDLTFDDAAEKGMNWKDVIRYWNPNLSDDETVEIYAEMKNMAHNDAIQGRRDCVTEEMIFNNIKYGYFKSLNVK